MSTMHSFYANTARWIAASRAKETDRPDRLFEDPFAAVLAGDRGFEILARSERAYGGVNPFIPVRTRFFDDTVRRQAETLPQAVMLGAGLDTRAFRLDIPPALRIFELDLPETLAYKESVLKAFGAVPRCLRSLVSTDLSGTWISDLLASGFDAGLPSLWIAEGLFFYLSEQSAGKLIDSARECSATGSMFLADILGSGVLEQPQLKEYLDWLAGNDVPPPFCTNRPDLFFERHGWNIENITFPGAPEANYGRLPARMQIPEKESDRAYFVTAVLR